MVMTREQESKDFKALMSGDPGRMIHADILTDVERQVLMDLNSRAGRIQSAALARLERVKIDGD